jgi:tetratricopeptide (TPR) repeat protein
MPLLCRTPVLLLLISFGVYRSGVASSRPRTEMLREIQELIQQHNMAQAEQQLTEALELFPKDAAFYDLLGVVEAQKGSYARAESDFLKAIDLDPLLTGAYLNLGQLYQEHAAEDRRARGKALAVYGKLLKLEPQNTEANYQSALLLQRAKAFQPSLERLSQLPAADQKKAQALSVRCADLAGLRDRAAAADSLDELLNSPDLKEADVLWVASALDGDHWEDLEARLLEGAVTRGMTGFNVLNALGQLGGRTGKLEAARSSLERAAQIQPGSVDVLLELARVADKQNDYRGALGYLAHARELDPANPAVHFFFGVIAVKENLLEEAYNSLKHAVSLSPENAYYNYAIGAVTQQRADPSEAIPFFKKYCSLRPHDPRGPLQLGISYFKSHQEDPARKELQMAAHHLETAAPAHFFLARIANQDGKYSEALRELEQALAADPNYADPYAEEGIIYMKQRQYAAAEKALLRALAINSDHYAANLTLMTLYQRTQDPRAGEQAKRFEEVKRKRAETAKLALRTIEVVP